MIYNMHKYLILIVLMINNAYSQELVPPIQNFSPSNYVAASQNWDIALDDRGVVYTANNQGLLVYDGLSWEIFTLESQSIIRSVYPHSDRIYTGSYKEFGYWENLPDGDMAYNSLTPLMSEFNMQSDEFWEIISYKEAIYFRSFGAVYKYEGDRITKIKDVVSTALGVFQDKIILTLRKEGLAYLDNNELIPLKGDQKILDDINIIDIESKGDTLFIAGKESIYTYTNNRFQKFPDNRLNEILERSELNHIISISEDEIVIGTIKNGIVNYNLKTGQIQVFNRTSGLQNNTVLGMSYDKGRLWLALDKGVDMIDLKAPVRFYTDNTGELGAVYDIQKFDDDYYLASNTGVYSFSENNLNLIENAEDHTWNLEVIDGVLYANHNTGIYRIENDQFIPIEARTGSFSIKKLTDGSNRLLIANYTGLSLYNLDSKEISEVSSVNFPIKEVIIGDNSTLWAAHPYEGVYRITHDDFSNVQVEKISALGGKANFNPKLYELNKQIIIYVNEKWFQYNPFKADFEIFEELGEYSKSRLLFEENAEYVFSSSDDGSIIITDLKDEKIVIPTESLNNRLVRSNENFVKENDSIFYITLNDGFARLNLNQLKGEDSGQWISEPFIKEFSDLSNRYNLTETPVIPFKNSRNIVLKAGMPVSDAVNLKYRLDGEENIQGTLNNGMINLRNLEHGDYELTLTASGSNEDSSAVRKFHFSIAPPWYLSAWMKTIYVFLFIGLIFLIYWLNQLKLKKHQFQLEEKFEKEHAERLNRIEKERLMNEIDLKRKELANTTMMAAKKNEVLMEIQGELNKDKTKFSNQFRLKHIMNKINSAVKSKDEWKVFETNFNEVHEDFFKDVLDQYPKLTSKDLKLCSYLKMNLSSKEIAPLMGISVRGVEVHRYRLRKKMELDSDVNLTKFLIKNF
ncbi:helix-turn-helix and ligand-binding sensor domain-containing protein [Christiangramia sp. SM2212]|uniref:LuxR C-terminal-related transcriptional regulator n=1 Tax=Christiangramia sediminicola TaxID=3073267 RepID=A0ABU1EMC1_9FLAO|nr:LuxR C-terminal-related transcriptional regulator [Christiangramia sp. SM2212]MDR5589533.1 LuxR C-terminal-related transcriptional regulator [Christiangramia sp. SM2212]